MGPNLKLTRLINASSELFKFIVVVITVSNLKLADLDAKDLADKKLVRSVTWR